MSMSTLFGLSLTKGVNLTHKDVRLDAWCPSQHNNCYAVLILSTTTHFVSFKANHALMIILNSYMLKFRLSKTK